jgi:hypothetical protein
VVIPVLDHDFSGSHRRAGRDDHGTVHHFKVLAAHQVPGVEVLGLKPGCRWSPTSDVACQK